MSAKKKNIAFWGENVAVWIENSCSWREKKMTIFLLYWNNMRYDVTQRRATLK